MKKAPEFYRKEYSHMYGLIRIVIAIPIRDTPLILIPVVSAHLPEPRAFFSSCLRFLGAVLGVFLYQW
ncbi:MAG: hypothetical protein R2912_04550 [Eubacteriales bacterium]